MILTQHTTSTTDLQQEFCDAGISRTAGKGHRINYVLVPIQSHKRLALGQTPQSDDLADMKEAE